MTLADDLRAARALIDTPEKWLKGAWHDQDNTCFCALGAAEFSIKESPISVRSYRIRGALRDAMPDVGLITDFNDHPDTTHADIMALFDRAIAAAEEQET